MHKTGCGWGCLLSASKGARAPRGLAEQPCPAKAPLDLGLTTPALPCLQRPQAPGSEAINESPGCSAFSLPCRWRARPQGPSCAHGSFVYLADTYLVLPTSLVSVHFHPHETLQRKDWRRPREGSRGTERLRDGPEDTQLMGEGSPRSPEECWAERLRANWSQRSSPEALMQNNRGLYDRGTLSGR